MQYGTTSLRGTDREGGAPGVAAREEMQRAKNPTTHREANRLKKGSDEAEERTQASRRGGAGSSSISRAVQEQAASAAAAGS